MIRLFNLLGDAHSERKQEQVTDNPFLGTIERWQSLPITCRIEAGRELIIAGRTI
jgi:hypothetical protein